MTLESDDEYTEDADSAWTPAVEGMDNDKQLPTDTGQQETDADQWQWQWIMPDDSDTDNDGRTGLLSTYTEAHAVVLGITAGAHFALAGEAQLITDVIGIGTAGDRARQANRLPDKYREQAKEELPYFLAAVLIGYVGARTDALNSLGMGIGAW